MGNTMIKPRGKPFKKGQSGNPTGRPKGSKHRLSEEFVNALADDFEQYGVNIIEKVRLDKPEAYLKIISSVLPRDLSLNMDDEPQDNCIKIEFVKPGSKEARQGVSDILNKK